MKPRTLLVLAVTVAVLAGFVFFYEKDLPSTDERRELEKKVLRLDSDEVEAVTLRWEGEKVRLERVAGEDEEASDSDEVDLAGTVAEWRLVEPTAARADGAAVSGLLSTLTGLERRRAAGVDRAEAGLEDPAVVVTLGAGSGETVLRVGAEVPASSDRLIEVTGPGAGESGVFLVSGGFVDELRRDPGEWRDKQLFHAGRDEIARVALESSGAKVLLAERGEGFWIESPLADRADENHVNALLTALVGLRATRFLDPAPPPTELGLEPPAGVVEAVIEGHEKPFRLELGRRPEGGLVGRSDGQVFELDTALEAAFERPAADWRDRSWSAHQVFEIEAARVEAPEDGFEIRRDGADWRRGEERIDYSAASDLLYALAEVEAEEVVERAEAEARGHALGAPRLTVDLTATDGAREELRLYSTHEGLAAATSGDREAVLLLPESAVVDLFAKVETARKAEALPEEEDEEEPGEETTG